MTSLRSLNVQCTGRSSGYGQVAAGLRDAFAARGIEDVEEPAGLALVVNPTFALGGRWEGQEVWAATFWETTRIPELVTEKIGNYAGIVCFTDYNRAQFAEHHPNVHQATLGIDPTVWHPLERKVDREWRVLVSGPKPGGNDLRKGFEEAKKAFALAFPHPEAMDPVPTLTLTHSFGKLTDAEMVALFADHHCYLALSKAEGWHLLPFQMLATGAPVVLNDNPGHRQWGEKLPGAYLTHSTLGPSPIGGVGSSWSGEWWEPDIEDAATLLRWVYKNYAEACDAARQGARGIAERYTWAHAAQGVLDAVGDHQRSEPKPIWQPAVCRTFTATALRSDTVDIGERRYRLKRGEQIELTADALRVLTQSEAVSA